MEKIKIGGQDYVIGQLNALDQLHLTRKLAPLVPEIAPVMSKLMGSDMAKLIAASDKGQDLAEDDMQGFAEVIQAAKPLTEALAKLSEEDTNYILFKCLSVCSRDGAALCRNNVLMFDDITLYQMVALAVAVVRLNLGDFIQELITKASSMQN